MPKAPVRAPIVRDATDLSSIETRRAIKQLDDPFIRRSEVKGVTLGTGDTLVKHQLGRIPSSWLITDQNANAQVWRSGPVSNDHMTMKASAAVTVNILFW